MPRKAEIAEQVARLESPGALEEDLAFQADALAKGFTKAALEERLRAALPAPEPETPPAAPSEPPERTDGIMGAQGEPGVALEPAPRSVLPEQSKWNQLTAMAAYVAQSGLCPDVLRKKPNDVGLIFLHAVDLGIPLTSALNNLYVIKGRIGMEAKLMRALVRRAGHSIWDDEESDGLHAIVRGRRADTGDEGFAEFTLDDARQQGLIRGYNAQTGVVQTLDGKPTWGTLTKTMLRWRATAVLCRDLFSDCLAGVSYTAEELGHIDYIDAEAPGTGAEEATVTVSQERSEIARRIADLPEDLKKGLGDEWRKRNLPRVDDLSPGGIRTVLRLLESLEEQANAREPVVAEAEIVAEGEEGPGPALGEAGVPGDSGGTTAGAAPSSPDAASAESAAELFCAGCGEAIREEPVLDTERRPFHPDCAPM